MAQDDGAESLPPAGFVSGIGHTFSPHATNAPQGEGERPEAFLPPLGGIFS